MIAIGFTRAQMVMRWLLITGAWVHPTTAHIWPVAKQCNKKVSVLKTAVSLIITVP
jgi:hypothetical protein